MKAKAIDQAAKKFDTVPADVLESRVSSRTSSGGGLLDEVDRVSGQSSGSYRPLDVTAPDYTDKVNNSKLPPEIQKAMRENPIPQPNMVEQITEDDIRDLNPGAYSEDDEYDLDPKRIKHQTTRRPVTEQKQTVEMVKGPTQKGFDQHVLRKMIAEEIAKALPGIVESYFDKKVIQENTRIMKNLIKSNNNR